MAQVDFSNAVLRPIPQGSYTVDVGLPLSIPSMGFYGYALFAPDSGTQVAQNVVFSDVSITLTNYIVRYTGEFTTSGTSFWIKSNVTQWFYWEVSNISFSAGDTFNFLMEANVTIE